MGAGRTFAEEIARLPALVKWSIVVAGLGLLVVGGLGLARTISLLLFGERTTGIVIGVEPVHDPRSNSRTWARVVEYTHPQAGTSRVTERVSSTHVRDGESVAVLYDPDDAKRALVGSVVNVWIAPLAQLLFGALFVGLGGIALTRK